MENYCSNCGTSLKPGWKACPNCGSATLENQNPLVGREVTTQGSHRNPYQRVITPSRQRSNGQNNGEFYGSIALIFAVVGLFFGFNIGIVAIGIGALGVKKEDLSYRSFGAIVIGIINLICFFLAFITRVSAWGIFGSLWYF